ncbi:MAG: DNA-directed RNA polymerase subunit beta' [Planctomycetota bacterium]|nr:MAG: DNA-directed RNA polymerase subunit beta' [Planctomycetota bacterium]
MLKDVYDRINDYGSVRIRLASPDDIRKWSFGEVKKPETINYRTYRPEKDGLFCEKIFGPEKDWECFCGKYKGIKHKGITCDRCGVDITHSRVRRTRMGHITLAAPVVHIWFFKAMPSRLGRLLGKKTTSLEKVIYFQEYIVIDKGDTPLKDKQLLTEDEYRRAREEYGDRFEAGMGAEAIKAILKKLDLNKLYEELQQQLRETRSKQAIKNLIKRLKIVKALRDSENDPSWMVLDVIPVIPPELRPLVLLESGHFATSDLNDLYRRVINRNNRLKKLLDLGAPEVIIRNEKRMLQQAVDSLFDNSRCRRPALGSNNRPLKSLTDMIKGKQGRFRQNLLGKRVDYSARSVIVVGPELKLHQCGLPKKIALELFQPFIIRRLKELGHADTIKSAKKMLERKDREVWDILEEVTHRHPVLLNRAPTLHRMGIQAFEPVLIEGNAIRLHPLVCAGFNADFDGDQMAVHLPLSYEAQIEATTLMLSTNNIFSPANGFPIIAASQDIVMGIYYLTAMVGGEKGEMPTREECRARQVPFRAYESPFEALAAHAHGKIELHARIYCRLPAGTELRESPDKEQRLVRPTVVETTVGRIIFNDALPPGMPFYNYTLSKDRINAIIADCHRRCGDDVTLAFLDDLKELGFRYATLGGLSFATSDLKIPAVKQEIIAQTEKAVAKVEESYRKGVITEGERYNQIIDLWTAATERIGEAMMQELKNDERDGRPYLNPIYLMATSGARGSVQQVRQLAGMRGLMAKPSGRIIETPIKANFREGLRVLEYFSSTHGARKGLADTALKTADSGYLTRKLADVAQNVVVTMEDCGTLRGITKSALRKGDQIDVPLWRNIRGRVARDRIVDIITDEIIVDENQLITEEVAQRIEGFLGPEAKVRVRSPLTCEAPLGVCAMCYGMDLSTGKRVELGLAVGIIAAQSIGEPGTQLTMRTFHIGGTASRAIEESDIKAPHAGIVRFKELTLVEQAGEKVNISRAGELVLTDAKGREIETFKVPVGAVVLVEDGAEVKKRQRLCKWDAHAVSILAEKEGTVAYEDIVEGHTMRQDKDPRTGRVRKVIIEHKGDLHPQVILKDRAGDIVAYYPIPERSILMVDEGQHVTVGTLIAKTPREVVGTQDITGGLPRVTELFEVRKPKSPAVLAEVDGVVELGEKRKGKRTIIVKNESGMEVEHLIPRGKHIRVAKGDYVEAGKPLVAGPAIPHDILRISGEEATQQYLLTEVQKVYRSQSVSIDDKHIEIIIAQMMRRVKIDNPGDTDFLPGDVVDKFQYKAENERVMQRGGKPATAKPMLLGITKASLFSESWISAASFQETTKVLTRAALAGEVDRLRGLKENVILGHRIPAGTGFAGYLSRPVMSEEKLAAQRALQEELAS